MDHLPQHGDAYTHWNFWYFLSKKESYLQISTQTTSPMSFGRREEEEKEEEEETEERSKSNQRCSLNTWDLIIAGREGIISKASRTRFNAGGLCKREKQRRHCATESTCCCLHPATQLPACTSPAGWPRSAAPPPAPESAARTGAPTGRHSQAIITRHADTRV